jgi:hypothetical protein
MKTGTLALLLLGCGCGARPAVPSSDPARAPAPAPIAIGAPISLADGSRCLADAAPRLAENGVDVVVSTIEPGGDVVHRVVRHGNTIATTELPASDTFVSEGVDDTITETAIELSADDTPLATIPISTVRWRNNNGDECASRGVSGVRVFAGVSDAVVEIEHVLPDYCEDSPRRCSLAVVRFYPPFGENRCGEGGPACNLERCVAWLSTHGRAEHAEDECMQNCNCGE